MTPTPARSRRAPTRHLKSPLALAGDYAGPARLGSAETADHALEGVALSDREATLAEFEDYLRTGQQPGRPALRRRHY
jgi:hypothetical protein